MCLNFVLFTTTNKQCPNLIQEFKWFVGYFDVWAIFFQNVGFGVRQIERQIYRKTDR